MSPEHSTTPLNESIQDAEQLIHPHAVSFFQAALGSDNRFYALSSVEANGFFDRASSLFVSTFSERSARRVNACTSVYLVRRFINGETAQEISESSNIPVSRIEEGTLDIAQTLITLNTAIHNRLTETIIEHWQNNDPDTVPIPFRTPPQTSGSESDLSENASPAQSASSTTKPRQAQAKPVAPFDPTGELVLWAVANSKLVDLSGNRCEGVSSEAEGMFGEPKEQRNFVAKYCAGCVVRNLCFGFGVGTKSTFGVYGLSEKDRRIVVRKNKELFAGAPAIYGGQPRPDLVMQEPEPKTESNLK